MSRARDLANRTIASAALPKAGGAMTGAITTNSTFDGVDVATDVAANTAKTGITSGQASAITANTAKVSFTPDAAQVFNDSGADVDFRIEGDNEANLFCVDASTDRVGIGTVTPSHLVNISKSNADYNAVIQNSSTSGHGLRIDGGNNDSSHYSLLCRDYAGADCLSVYGNGRVKIGPYGMEGSAILQVRGPQIAKGNNSQAIWVKHPDATLAADNGGGIAFELSYNTSGHSFHAASFQGRKADNGNNSVEGYAIITCSSGSAIHERFRIHPNGNVSGTHGSYHTSSDERMKTNVVTIDGALTKICSLRGIHFNWIPMYEPSGDQTTNANIPAGEKLNSGFIAQEVEAIIPEAVTTQAPLPEKDPSLEIKDENGDSYDPKKYAGDDSEYVPIDGAKAVLDGNQITAYLVEAIKELSAKVTTLENA